MQTGTIPATELPSAGDSWTDAHWFKYMWDTLFKQITHISEDTSREVRPLTASTAVQLAIPVFNHFVIHKVLRDVADPENIEECKSILYPDLCKRTDAQFAALMNSCIRLQFLGNQATVDFSKQPGGIFTYDSQVMTTRPSLWTSVLRVIDNVKGIGT